MISLNPRSNLLNIHMNISSSQGASVQARAVVAVFRVKHTVQVQVLQFPSTISDNIHNERVGLLVDEAKLFILRLLMSPAP